MKFTKFQTTLIIGIGKLNREKSQISVKDYHLNKNIVRYWNVEIEDGKTVGDHVSKNIHHMNRDSKACREVGGYIKNKVINKF